MARSSAGTTCFDDLHTKMPRMTVRKTSSSLSYMTKCIVVDRAASDVVKGPELDGRHRPVFRRPAHIDIKARAMVWF